MREVDAGDFSVVRVLCHRCGWFRVVGFTGSNETTVAAIRLFKAKSRCNVLSADVVLLPAGDSSALTFFPDYHDLRELGHRQGLRRTVLTYRALFDGQSCPRCRSSFTDHEDALDILTWPSFPIERHKSWKVFDATFGRFGPRYWPNDPELLRDEPPLRGRLCDCCGTRIPRFAALSEQVRLRILRLIFEGRTALATAELRAATGCGSRWAKTWIQHRGEPQPHFPGPACPVCDTPLPNSLSEQCLSCKADWHGHLVAPKTKSLPPNRGELLWSKSVANVIWDVVFLRPANAISHESPVWLLHISSSAAYSRVHWWAPSSQMLSAPLPALSNSDIESLKAALVESGRVR